MINLNTNLSSLITQRSLTTSTQCLNQAIEQMTTGFKINHAKDNAANYNITTNMTTKIGAYMVAEDNCAMGLDLLATANGSLDQISDKLQRLRALAVQTSNGTYGPQSLAAINQEANAIVDEIERIYNTTEYNGIKLFDNEPQYELPDTVPRAQYDGFIKEVVKRDTSAMTTLASVDGSVALADGTYSISTPEEMKKLADMTNAGLVSAGDEFVLANDIDLSQYENWTPIGITNTSRFKGVLDGNGYKVVNLTNKDLTKDYVAFFGDIYFATVKNLAIENANINGRIQEAGLCHQAWGSSIENCFIKDSNIFSVNAAAGGFAINLYYTELDSCYVENCNILGRQGTAGICCYLSGNATLGEAVVKNSYVKDLELTAEESGKSGGIIAHSGKSSNRIEHCAVLSGISGIKGIFSGGFNSDVNTLTIKDCYYDSYYQKEAIPLVSNNIGLLSLENINCYRSELKKIVFQIGIGGSLADFIITEDDLNIGFNVFRLIGMSTKYQDTYLSRIDLIDAKIKKKQTEFGAVENRLESALEEISVQYENLVSSRSTLRDADIAEVSSEYIRQQILQQASATLMATANQSPSIALQLI